MKILLCGDSWMVGCYQIPAMLEPTHPGFQSFLVEDGHSVINLAVQGGSNELQLQKIDTFFEMSAWRPDVIIFMQCALMRRYRNFANLEFLRQIQPELLEQGIKNGDFDFNRKTVDEILSPIVFDLAKKLKSYNIPVIIASGNTKMHSVWKEYFEHVLPSGDKLWGSHTDSYFSDQDSVDRFISVVLKNSNQQDRTAKKKLMIQVMEDFNNKWDAWHNNPEWISVEHGRIGWHQKLYQEIKPFLSTLSK
jgi:hypothetical protein